MVVLGPVTYRDRLGLGRGRDGTASYSCKAREIWCGGTARDARVGV